MHSVTIGFYCACFVHAYNKTIVVIWILNELRIRLKYDNCNQINESLRLMYYIYPFYFYSVKNSKYDNYIEMFL